MVWSYLIGLALLIWGTCGAVMAVGRHLWGLQTALRVHLAAAPAIAFLLSIVHARIDPACGSLLRATVVTGLVVALDALVVAPLFERSYDMFRSLIGTWVPFALIFLAGWAAGLLMS
jgi:hypothetical protein